MNPGDSNSKENKPIEPIKPESISSSPFIEPSPGIFSEDPTKSENKENIDINDFEKRKSEETPKSSNGMEEAVDYMRNNKESLATYFALAIGLLFLVLGDFFLGSLIIGLTAGYHFSYEIVFYLRNVSHIFEGHEHLRFLVLTTVIIGFFLSIPGIFIGSIVAAVFKHVIYDKRE